MPNSNPVTLSSLICFNDGLDDDPIDYPTDEADENTYEFPSYAITSACLSDNLLGPDVSYLGNKLRRRLLSQA